MVHAHQNSRSRLTHRCRTHRYSMPREGSVHRFTLRSLLPESTSWRRLCSTSLQSGTLFNGDNMRGKRCSPGSPGRSHRRRDFHPRLECSMSPGRSSVASGHCSELPRFHVFAPRSQASGPFRRHWLDTADRSGKPGRADGSCGFSWSAGSLFLASVASWKAAGSSSLGKGQQGRSSPGLQPGLCGPAQCR